MTFSFAKQVYEQEIIDRGEKMANDVSSLMKTFGGHPVAPPTVYPALKLPSTFPLPLPLGPGGLSKVAKGKRSKTKLPKAKKVAEKVAAKSVKESKVTKAGKKSKERARKPNNKSVTVQKVIIFVLFSYELNNNELPACFFIRHK